MLNDAKNLGSSLFVRQPSVSVRAKQLKNVHFLPLGKTEAMQTALLRQPVHDTALYMKTDFSMRTEQGKQFLSLLIQQICTEHLQCHASCYFRAVNKTEGFLMLRR